MSAQFEVVHGDPNAEELAVVISLLTAAAGSTTAAPEEPRLSNWARPGMRVTVHGGPGAWFISGLPR